MCCDPGAVAAVTQAFLDRLPRFVEYEDFGGYFELLRMDVEEVQLSTHSWYAV